MANKFGGFGGGGMGNMQQMLKQAQKMQEQMQKAQEELENAELLGESGNGLVQITLNGKKKLLGIKIDPKCVDAEDVEMLEDLILAAYNDAEEQADAMYQEKMGAFGAIL